MLVSEIVSLKVVSIWDKSFEGFVENVLFDKNNKVKYLKIYNENNNLTYCIEPSNIFKISSSTILIKNNCVLCPLFNLELSAKTCFNPIGATLYDFEGTEQGIITDLQIDEKFNICNIFTNSTQLNIKNIFVFGENISFIKPEKQVKLSNFSPKKKIKVSKSEISVKGLKNSSDNLASEKKEQQDSEHDIKNKETEISKPLLREKNSQNLTSPTSPKRIITDYRFLLNRILIDNLLLPNGEVLIRKNSKINSQVIEKARTFGKLVELTQKSK